MESKNIASCLFFSVLGFRSARNFKMSRTKVNDDELVDELILHCFHNLCGAPIIIKELSRIKLTSIAHNKSINQKENEYSNRYQQQRR